METHKRFGLRTIITLVLFLTLTKSLSSTAFDVSEYEDWKSIDIADSILSYGYVLEPPLLLIFHFLKPTRMSILTSTLNHVFFGGVKK